MLVWFEVQGAGGRMKTFYLCMFFGGVFLLFCFGVYDWFRSYGIVRADMRKLDAKNARKNDQTQN